MYAADSRHPDKTLEEKLQAIYQLRGGPMIDLTIRPSYKDLLAALGNPQDHLPPVIHVAGTNGKGSVIAMLRAVFEQAGYNVHTYTSPHLLHFNERIVLAGQEISDHALEALLDEVMTANQNAPLTFFEITTALAFTAFARKPADILLLETGLGGRLDCTNVIAKPLACVITRIGYDHTEFLGDTIEQIAGEKAGIMKASVPCILGPQTEPAIEAVFEQKAQEVGCPLIRTETSSRQPTNMAGPHQHENAAIALACLAHCHGFDIAEKDIKQGLQNVRWRARLQRLEDPALPPGSELWIDGGHNEIAGQALAAQAACWAEQDGKKLHLILGMMETKDPQKFIAPLLPYIDSITCVKVSNEESAFPPAALAQLINASQVTVLGNVDQALAALPNYKNTRTLVAGSLYLAGEMLRKKASILP